MTIQELRIIAVLASIFALRMLGLCMLLPIFAVEALSYADASVQLIGIAVGVYGLAQAILQVPFGMLSDRYGRKPLIFIGLVFILLGSLIAANTQSIYGLIAGRLLQGCGAIGSVVIATLADQTREQVRSSAMAILGMSIGVAFVVAMVLGPWLNQAFGFASIFVVTAALATGCVILLIAIPNTAIAQPIAKPFILSNQQLMSLNFGAFALHAGLAALFLVLPAIVQRSGVLPAKVWLVYLVVLMVAMLVTLYLIRRAERSNAIEKLQNLAILGLLVAPGFIYIFQSVVGIIVSLIVYFTAFCCLEASLPTLVARHAKSNNRGAAMGMYSTLQFLGVFIGGMIGGWLHSKFGVVAVIGFCIMLAVAWLIFGAMVTNRLFSTTARHNV